MPAEIKAIGGDEPHPSYGGWRRFLTEHCEVRGQAEGVVWYASTNCNYFVFPDGTLFANYGYHGRVLFKDIQEAGAEAVLQSLRATHELMREALTAKLEDMKRLNEQFKQILANKVAARKARSVKMR